MPGRTCFFKARTIPASRCPSRNRLSMRLKRVVSACTVVASFSFKVLSWFKTTADGLCLDPQSCMRMKATASLSR
ncbi:hypothetical protein BCR44DRAFT_1429316 [Catenaria anguillulae PL171]|uniref:Uncharacterized protein n=1 Tax=Catenaria anguillulae PL171 TaxID=765915 RepID=A0A1Y2HXT7_9FUNG|nr:hypothetical protein BCR44DRAFT_1429316 [Catenaria anguillulae PL171]